MKFNIIYINWPLTGKNVVVAKSATFENASKTADKWARHNPGAKVLVVPV